MEHGNHDAQLNDYVNTRTPIKELVEKHGCSDRVLYAAIRDGKIQKRDLRRHDTFMQIESNPEQKYYLLGLIASDGDVRNRNKVIDISLRDYDKDILIALSQAIYGEDRTKERRKSKCVRLLIHGREIYDMVLSFGITKKKSETLKVNLDQIPPQHFHHFLRGYIDGDGSYYVGYPKKGYFANRITICGNHYMMSSFVKYVQKYYDLKSYCYPDRTSPASFPFYHWTIQKKTDTVKLLNYLYGGATLYLQRKFNTISSLLNSAVQA